MFCALLGQDIRWAFTGPLVLWFVYFLIIVAVVLVLLLFFINKINRDFIFVRIPCVNDSYL